MQRRGGGLASFPTVINDTLLTVVAYSIALTSYEVVSCVGHAETKLFDRRCFEIKERIYGRKVPTTQFFPEEFRVEREEVSEE